MWTIHEYRLNRGVCTPIALHLHSPSTLFPLASREGPASSVLTDSASRVAGESSWVSQETSGHAVCGTSSLRSVAAAAVSSAVEPESGSVAAMADETSFTAQVGSPRDTSSETLVEELSSLCSSVGVSALLKLVRSAWLSTSELFNTSCCWFSLLWFTGDAGGLSAE